MINELKGTQQTMILCPDTLHQMALANYIARGLKDGSLVKYLEENKLKYQRAILGYVQMYRRIPSHEGI